MRKWPKRILLGLITLAAVAYVGACLWLAVNETRIVFGRRAPYVPPSPSLALNQERTEFGDLDGTKLIAWIIPSLPQDNSNVWLLYFHGSAENVSNPTLVYDSFREMGFNIMAPEYPGYLDAPGVPSEAAVEREAQVAYDYLRVVKQVPAKNIVIFGYSLGTGVGIDLASRVEAGALIEQSGPSSIIALGQEQYPIFPVRFFVRNRFESDTKIGQVKMPFLAIHSTEDEVVPFAHAQQLYELARPPKRLLRIRGKHEAGGTSATLNPDFFIDIATFLNAKAGFHLRQPLPSISPVIAATIESTGIEAALAQYRSLRAENPARYNFREYELDVLGYELLEKKKISDAIAVFELNAKQFPQSFSVFDSLGDVYVAAGKNAEAIQNYQQSLALFPAKENYSRAKLDRLQGKSQGR